MRQTTSNNIFQACPHCQASIPVGVSFCGSCSRRLSDPITKLDIPKIIPKIQETAPTITPAIPDPAPKIPENIIGLFTAAQQKMSVEHYSDFINDIFHNIERIALVSSFTIPREDKS